MRVSTSYRYEMFQSEIDRTSSSYLDAQQQVSSGKRINNLSDDPYGATVSISMRTLKAQLEQYNANLDQAKGFLGYTESSLSEITKVLNSVYQVAVQGANSTNDAAANQALVTQLNTLQTRIVDLANSQGPNGEYLFAGQKTDSAPYSIVNGALTCAGDSNSILVETSPNSQMAVNIPGGATFTNLYQTIANLKSDLSAGNLSKISSQDIASIKSGLDQITQLNGQVGAKLQTIATQSQDNQKRITDFTASISGVEDVDVAQAMVNLTKAQTAYQAALMTTGQANKFSLLDFIQ